MKVKNVVGCQAIICITLTFLCAPSVSIGPHLRQAHHAGYFVSKFVTLSARKEVPIDYGLHSE
jgi:hypothetical protein